jgi:hypothetical protein
MAKIRVLAGAGRRPNHPNWLRLLCAATNADMDGRGGRSDPRGEGTGARAAPRGLAKGGRYDPPLL